MSKNLKKIIIDNINLGSNFEVASYRTQRNTGGVAPVRGNGNIIATNNFVLDDEVVLNFKVNKNDLINFCKIYARFKTKGMLLVESPLLAYKLVHGDMENMYTFNSSFIAGSKVTIEEAKRMTDEILKTKHFFAMLSDFNIKSLNQTAGGFEIEMVLQTWSDLINDDVVKMYNDLANKQTQNQVFISIDSAISKCVNKVQDLKLMFTVTNEEITTSEFGNEYVVKTKNEAIRRLKKIEAGEGSEAEKNELKKKATKELLRLKLKKEMSWLYYQISEFEVRMKNNIVSIPIQGKPKPFKQHLGVGECYITVKIIMDENNVKDKEKIKEIKRLTSIKQNDIFTEMEFGIINALDLKSVTVANVFFTNDDESDSVIVSIIFAANAYSREDLSIYNPKTIVEKTTANTYAAFNKWLNMTFVNPKEFKNYTIDVGDKEKNSLTMLGLSKIYNEGQWQDYLINKQSKNFDYLKKWHNKHTKDGLIKGKVEDLALITNLSEIIETYAFLLLKNGGNTKSEPILEFKKFFAYGKDKTVDKGSALDVFLNYTLTYPIINMVTQSSDEYQDKDGLNTFHIFMRSFYSDFKDRLERMYISSTEQIKNASLYKNDKTNIGNTIDKWIDEILANLGKSDDFTNFERIKRNDILGYLKVHLNNEVTKSNIYAAIKTLDTNIKGENQRTEDALKTNINTAINNIDKNLKYFTTDNETIKDLCKIIVKIKMFKYFAENNNPKNINVYIMTHIMSTIIMIPFMIDVYNVSSTYGHVAMRSAEYVIQYYKVLFKSCLVNPEVHKVEKQNLAYILNKIFGKNFGNLLTSSTNVDMEFKEKKDYQKYLGIEINDANKPFKTFFDIIMNVQAHKSKQDFFAKHLQHFEQIQKTLERDLENNMVVNPLNYTENEKHSCIDNDKNKEIAINNFLSDANIIYQDMFASDLDSTGTLYSFNKLLGGNNIKNWFAKNNIAIRQAASLKFIYKKYENLQRIFNYEYNKILPDYKVTLIQESITNGVVSKRRYVNLNEYVGLDKIINISISFDEETRIKTAVIQLIDSTNLLSTMSQEIVVKSSYRDIIQEINKQEITYNDEYYSEYPMIKPGQLIKIEMGYAYENELETEFTGVIINVNVGRITTIVCNNFMADLANGDISVQRYEDVQGSLNPVNSLNVFSIRDRMKNFDFLHNPSRVSDLIGDAHDTSAKAKAHYNEEFISSSSAKPYNGECETASNFNILAEALRKQPNSLIHLNNGLEETKQFGAISNEIADKKSKVEKTISSILVSRNTANRIYENINNVDQDEEIYGHILIIDPTELEGSFDKYIVKKDSTVAEKFKKMRDEYEKNKSVFSKLPLTFKKIIHGDFIDRKIESVIFRTGSPFCYNNFQSMLLKMETDVDVKGNIGYSTYHEIKSYASNFSKKHTNVYEILKIIEKRLPGVFFNVLEYGDFGTLFLGRENYNIKTVKETNKITASDVGFLFSAKLMNLGKNEDVKNFNIYSLRNINNLEILASCAATNLSGKFDEKTQQKILSLKSSFTSTNKSTFSDTIKEYKNVHTLVSGKNLISCNIQINYNFYNAIFVDYKLSIQDFFNELVNLRFGGITLKLYNGLSKDKSRIKKIDHKELCIYTRSQALSVAQSALINEVENIYSGEIVTLYTPGIKYRDEVVIQNYEDKIFGTVIVKDFKHIFNQDGAFTIITPMMKVQMNSLSNELLHDSLYSQLFFLNPEFKTSFTPPVSEVDKTLKNMMANDALHKPIYFDGYAYELKEKNPNSKEGFIDGEIMMNSKLPLKVFPLIQKDVFMFPDMEDYGRQQPPFIAEMLNYLGMKTSQFGYYMNEYNWRKQISLFSSQVFYNLTSGIRNWYNESGENLKYQSPDSVFLGDIYKQNINNMTSTNIFEGTMQSKVHPDSRITKAQEQSTDEYGFLWFNTKDTVAGTYNIKGDIKLKGNKVSKQKQKEKQILLGDMASQFDIISFVEIYAKTLNEAMGFAQGICDRANAINNTKNFAVASAALLCCKDYKFVKQNGEYVVSNTKSSNTTKGIKESYSRILQSVIAQNKFDIISISALNKLQSAVVKNDGIDVDETKDDFNEYGVVIYNKKSFSARRPVGDTLKKIKQAHAEGKIILDGISNDNTLFNDSNKYNCLLSINYGESSNERVRRNSSITLFDPIEEKDKTKTMKNKTIAVACFHNYFGSGDKITQILERRRMCAQKFFEGIANTFNEDCGFEPIIMGDFNLDITTTGGNTSYDSERYYLDKGKLDITILQKTHSITTTGNKLYDKMFVSKFYKSIASEAITYQQYLVPANNTETNTQEIFSDHLPLIMYIPRRK